MDTPLVTLDFTTVRPSGLGGKYWASTAPARPAATMEPVRRRIAKCSRSYKRSIPLVRETESKCDGTNCTNTPYAGQKEIYENSGHSLCLPNSATAAARACVPNPTWIKQAQCNKEKSREKDIKRKLAEYLPAQIGTCSVPLAVTKYDLPGISQKMRPRHPPLHSCPSLPTE